MTDWVDVDGVRIAWEALGPEDAPVVVFSHSFGTDRALWKPQAESLVTDYRVVLAETRGHGRSDAPQGSYSLEVLARDVLAVADAAGASRFHLCGISLGGQIALWVASCAADRLTSVVACNTAGKIGTAESWSARINAVRSGGMDSVREAVIGGWFSPGFAAAHPDWFATANDVFSSTSVDGYIGCCGALSDVDLRDAVSRITVPTLVIGGGRDTSTPPVQAEWLHGAIPRSELSIFEDAAHLSNLDAHEAFTARLLGFLTAVD